MSDLDRERKDSDKSLIECINALHRSIENKSNSPELQVIDI